MILKFQDDFPGEQPTIGANSLATMAAPVGPRIGAVYIEVMVVLAALGVDSPFIYDEVD